MGRWRATGSPWPATASPTTHFTWSPYARLGRLLEVATYYRKKMEEGKSHKEALRCLKRRVSDAVFRSLVANSQTYLQSAA